MANFIVSYELEGTVPSHQQMDMYLTGLGPKFTKGRLMETVWFVGGPTNALALRDYVQKLLSPDDLLLVVEIKNATWTKLLVGGAEFKAIYRMAESPQRP